MTPCPIVVISICLFVNGCSDSEKGNANEDMEESNMSDEIIYDFYSFLRAPASTEKQGFSEVIKIVVTKNEHSQDETIAFDVENNEILIDPWLSSHGVNSSGDTEQIEDMDELLEILETYNVQDWKKDYTVEDPSSYEDGIGWNLWFQYKDGTVQSSRGSGTGLESITPERFGDFFNELSDFVNERLEDRDA